MLDQIAALTTIFDQYRFHKCEVVWSPRLTQVTTISSAPGTNLFTVIDYDDNVSPTSVSQMRDYQSCQEVDAYTKVHRTVYPRLAVPAYGGSLFNQYMSMKSQWLDTSSHDARHYGFKALSSGGNSVQTWDVKITMYVDFRMLH